MSMLRGRHLALLLCVPAIAAAGCGSSKSSKSQAATPPSPTTSSTPSPAAVAQGNAPIKLAFDDPGYPAACQKSLTTPNGQGKAFSPALAKTMCGCLQQQAKAEGLSSKSEESITTDQFRSLFSTCAARLKPGGTPAGTTT